MNQYFGLFLISYQRTITVAYDKLQERLISTGKLDAGESVLMIELMEKAGKIEKTGEYNIYKIGKSVATKEEQYAIIMLHWNICYGNA